MNKTLKLLLASIGLTTSLQSSWGAVIDVPSALPELDICLEALTESRQLMEAKRIIRQLERIDRATFQAHKVLLLAQENYTNELENLDSKPTIKIPFKGPYKIITKEFRAAKKTLEQAEAEYIRIKGIYSRLSKNLLATIEPAMIDNSTAYKALTLSARNLQYDLDYALKLQARFMNEMNAPTINFLESIQLTELKSPYLINERDRLFREGGTIKSTTKKFFNVNTKEFYLKYIKTQDEKNILNEALNEVPKELEEALRDLGRFSMALIDSISEEPAALGFDDDLTKMYSKKIEKLQPLIINHFEQIAYEANSNGGLDDQMVNNALFPIGFVSYLNEYLLTQLNKVQLGAKFEIDQAKTTLIRMIMESKN